MKIQTKKVINVGLAFLIICMFWQIYDNIIAKMLINTFGLNQTISGIVMALDNFLALFLLPLFGYLSDKTKSKIGKRTPYIIFGVIASAILFIGVSLFDNLQMKKLREVDDSQIVCVNEELFDENNEYYYLISSLDENQKNQMLSLYYNDFYYSRTITNDELIKYFSLNKKILSSIEINKYFCLTDIELSENHFIEIQKFLTEEDKEKFADILNLTHEKRVENNKNRTYQKELDLLNETLALRINEFYSKNDDLEGLKNLLVSINTRKYYSVKEDAVQIRGKVIFEFTKNNLGYLIGFLLILLLTLVVMAVYRTPAVSLMPDVIIKPLRSKANAIINLMGTIGGVISLILMTFLAKDYHSYLALFIVISVIMIILLLAFLRGVNEPQLLEEKVELEKKLNIEEFVEEISKKMPRDVRKSFYLILISIVFWFMAYNAATTKFSVYAGDVLNMGYTIPLLIANITALISYIPIGIIASKIGRKKTILIGILFLLLAFILGSIARENTKFLIYGTMGIAGIGWATINVNSYPMIVEMSKNNNIGKYTGFYYTASMFAQILTPVLSGVIMDLAKTMTVLFPYSIIFCILSFITMLFVRHGDSKPVAVKTIEVYDE